MKIAIIRACVVLGSLFWGLCLSVQAQRHLPELQIFESVETVLLDALMEFPAINNGRSVASRPRIGENVSIQIFVPRSAGLILFDCSIELDNPDGALANTFRIVSIKDWLQRDLRPLSSKKSLVFYSAKLQPAPILENGHVATVVLAPLQTVNNPEPLKITCFITVVSTPPRRVWQMWGSQQLYWQ